MVEVPGKHHKENPEVSGVGDPPAPGDLSVVETVKPPAEDSPDLRERKTAKAAFESIPAAYECLVSLTDVFKGKLELPAQIANESAGLDPSGRETVRETDATTLRNNLFTLREEYRESGEAALVVAEGLMDEMERIVGETLADNTATEVEIAAMVRNFQEKALQAVQKLSEVYIGLETAKEIDKRYKNAVCKETNINYYSSDDPDYLRHGDFVDFEERLSELKEKETKAAQQFARLPGAARFASSGKGLFAKVAAGMVTEPLREKSRDLSSLLAETKRKILILEQGQKLYDDNFKEENPLKPVDRFAKIISAAGQRLFAVFESQREKTLEAVDPEIFDDSDLLANLPDPESNATRPEMLQPLVVIMERYINLRSEIDDGDSNASKVQSDYFLRFVNTEGILWKIPTHPREEIRNGSKSMSGKAEQARMKLQELSAFFRKISPATLRALADSHPELQKAIRSVFDMNESTYLGVNGRDFYAEDTVDSAKKLLEMRSPYGLPIAILQFLRRKMDNREENPGSLTPTINTYIEEFDGLSEDQAGELPEETAALLRELVSLMKDNPDAYQQNILPPTENGGHARANPFYNKIQNLSIRLSLQELKVKSNFKMVKILDPILEYYKDGALDQSTWQDLSSYLSSSPKEDFGAGIQARLAQKAAERSLRDDNLLFQVLSSYKELSPDSKHEVDKKATDIIFRAAFLAAQSDNSEITSLLEEFAPEGFDQVDVIKAFRSLIRIIGNNGEELYPGNTKLETLAKLGDDNERLLLAVELNHRHRFYGEHPWNGINELKNPKETRDLFERSAQNNLMLEIHYNELKSYSMLAENTDNFIFQMKLIQKFTPNFAYTPRNGYGEKDIDLANIQPIVVWLSSEENIGYVLERIAMEQGSEWSIDDETMSAISKSLLTYGRLTDPLLAEDREKAMQISDDCTAKFRESLRAFSKFVGERPDEQKDIFANQSCLRFLGRQPEKVNDVMKLLEDFPQLFNNLLAPGGQLYNMRGPVIGKVFENGNVSNKAREIQAIFSAKIPYWKQLFLFTDTKIGEDLMKSESNYRVNVLPKIVFDPSISYKVDDFNITKDFNFREIDLTQTEPRRLRSYLIEGEALSDDELTDFQQNGIPFNRFLPIYKKMIYHYHISRSIGLSQDLSEKSAAHDRNCLDVPDTFRLNGPSAAHGTGVNTLPMILENGGLPGESIGEHSSVDRYPFHFDFWKLDRGTIQSMEDFNKKTGVRSYAKDGTGLIVIFDRSDRSYLSGKDEFAGIVGNLHYVMLGGMPSTEIKSIICMNPEALDQVKNQIADNEFYIPVYDAEGRLVFTEEEFDERQDDQKPYDPSSFTQTATMESIDPSKSSSEIFQQMIDKTVDQTLYLDDLKIEQKSTLHKFNLAEHLVRVTETARVFAERYGLSARDIELVTIAARLHDIGKTDQQQAGQWFENPTIAIGYLDKVRGLSVSEKQDILALIQYDELPGKILQSLQSNDMSGAEKAKASFDNLFKDERSKKMLLSLYRADVLEIDGTGDVYRGWEVDKYLGEFNLDIWNKTETDLEEIHRTALSS